MEDLEYEAKKKRLEDEDNKRDASRRFASISLIGLVSYPVALIIAGVFGLEKSIEVLGSIAISFFSATSLIVITFIGGEAYKDKKSEDK